jgi:hypothetical protein
VSAGAVRERDSWVWGGLAVVGIAAAVLSFSALADLAYRCGMTGSARLLGWTLHLSWLLPLAVDVFAITATVIWLRRRVSADALSYAQRAAWAAIASTVAGNAYHGYLVNEATAPPWGAAVLVSAVPAVALGALVHLAVLVGRSDVDEPLDDRPTDRWARLHDDVLAEPWAQAIARWAEQQAPAARTVPGRDEPDEVLAADLRAEDAARRAEGLGPLPRDGIVERYRVGKPRAGKLRTLVEALDRAAEARQHDSGGPVAHQPAGPHEQLDEPLAAGGRTAGGWPA